MYLCNLLLNRQMKKPFHYIYVYMYSLNDKIKGHTQLGTVIGDDI